MNKLWLENYPPGIPAEIDMDGFESLQSVLIRACDRYGNLPAFSNQGTTISFRQLNVLSNAFASYLHNVAGLQKGDRIALMMPNLLQYPIALAGALRAGCIVVNTNPMYTARELEYQLKDSGATAIVVLENFAHTLQEVLHRTSVRHVIITSVGELLHFPKAQLVNLVVRHVRHLVPEWHIGGAVPFTDAIKRGEELPVKEIQVQPGDTAFLQYTGGTTGVPKGAVLTHANIVANLRQTSAWVTGVLEEGRETALIPLPLYHVFALTATLVFFNIGAHNVLVTNPRDIAALVKEMKSSACSAMIGVNTLFNAILNADAAEHAGKSHLKVVVAGGMALQRAVAEKWHQRFGVPLIEGYGLTETSPIACANPLNITHYTGTVGLPLPSTEIMILGDEGQELPLGEAGEVCVRGPQVMKGYWNKPEETARAFAADGWLRTGDIGYMDPQGYVKLVDRKKDMIIVSGFKVFPNEVEDVVAEHPGVFEVAAIGEKDEHSGQVVKIVVVRKDASLTSEALVEHCRRRLAAYKVPRYVVFRTEPLPKSTIGKVLRRVVKEEEDEARSSPSIRDRQADPA